MWHFSASSSELRPFVSGLPINSQGLWTCAFRLKDRVNNNNNNLPFARNRSLYWGCVSVSFSVSVSAPAVPATVTSILRPRQYASHGIRVKAAPVRPRLCTSISVTLPQPHVSTTQVGTHPVRLATTYKRSGSTALAGTHNPVGVAIFWLKPIIFCGFAPKPHLLPCTCGQVLPRTVVPVPQPPEVLVWPR